MDKKRDKAVDKISSFLKNSNGLTITEIVSKTKLSRSAIRTALAKLDGAEKVSVRKIGMAKVYLLIGERNEKILNRDERRYE